VNNVIRVRRGTFEKATFLGDMESTIDETQDDFYSSFLKSKQIGIAKKRDVRDFAFIKDNS